VGSSGVNSRHVTLNVLRLIHRQNTYADMALDRILNKNSLEISQGDRALITELVYGITRRQRTLDALIEKFTGRAIARQSLDLRLILQIGIYQICYLDHIPVSAAVNTSVMLAKLEQLGGLTGLVNGVLRSLCRSQEQNTLFEDVKDLGALHSFPDWLIEFWSGQFGVAATEQLCEWFNRSPHIDLRVNFLKAQRAEVLAAFERAGITATALPHIPTAIRLGLGSGSIPSLPGFAEGWWSVQDASAQLAAYLLDPQPEELIIDACAAPGGKTTHIAELSKIGAKF
jgi:16S rRNA (cytosine967-C5)-methyltransferase